GRASAARARRDRRERGAHPRRERGRTGGVVSAGPLSSLRVIELASRGPGPFAAMLLADMGADVVRIDRPDPAPRKPPPELDVLTRGRRSIVVDLKHAGG